MIYLQSVLIIQLIKIIITIPVISYLFYQLLSLTELEGLTDQNIKSLLFDPTSLLILLTFIFIITFSIYFELGFFFVLADKQRSKVTYTYKSIFMQLTGKIKYFFSFYFILFTLYFLLILPLASLGLDVSLTENIKIPEFITDELLTMAGGKFIFYGFMAFLFYLSVRLMFSVPYFVTEPALSIKDAVLKSFQHTRENFFNIVITIALIISTFSLVSLLVIAIITAPLIMFENYFTLSLPIFAGITLTILQAFFVLASGTIQPIMSDIIYQLAYPNQPSKIINHEKQTIFTWIKNRKRILQVGFLGLIILAGFNAFSLNATIYQPTTQIVAHRGNTSEGLENTIASLVAAKDAQADFVEMDIQETSDNQFVVYHDANLKRLSKTRGTISQMRLDELTEVTISNKTYTEKIPSFEAYIDKAKELDIQLLVEIKLHGKESPHFAQNLVTLLEEKGVADSYIVQSLDYDILMKIQAINPEIKTSYVLALNIGNLPLTETPYLGLEEFSINDTLLKEADEKQIEIMIWTVNKTDLLHKHIRNNSAYIITNYPREAVEIRDSYNKSQTFTKRIKYLLDI